MARAYLKRSCDVQHERSAAFPVPGFRISELIDQFYAEGVVPEFLPADLGYDDDNEVDADGWPAVDPQGRIDVDRIDRLESQMTSGIPDDVAEPSALAVPVTPSSE